MKTVLVDDNKMEITALELYCNKSKEIEHFDSFQSSSEALNFLNKDQNIDLLFLDIEMPDMNGLELLDQLKYSPLVVITSSNKAYAFDAFEYEVVDFLNKPILASKFLRAVEKVNDRYIQRNKIALSSAASELYVRSDGKLVRISYDDVLYFENVGDYIKVITSKGLHIINGALKTLAEKLTHPRFLKVHRSYIVNLDKIIDIEDNSLLIGRKVIPISRAHKSLVLNSINII